MLAEDEGDVFLRNSSGTFNGLHGAISLKTENFTTTAARTSKSTTITKG
jgi:hypothetical protein